MGALQRIDCALSRFIGELFPIFFDLTAFFSKDSSGTYIALSSVVSIWTKHNQEEAFT